MKTMIIISGSRNISDFNTIKTQIDKHIDGIEFPEFVLGGAKGVDSLALRYAQENGFHYKILNANWGLYGKRAGMVRNGEMFRYGDQNHQKLIIFWDGSSRGTKNMIDRAEEKGWNKIFSENLNGGIVNIVYEK